MFSKHTVHNNTVIKNRNLFLRVTLMYNIVDDVLFVVIFIKRELEFYTSLTIINSKFVLERKI